MDEFSYRMVERKETNELASVDFFWRDCSCPARRQRYGPVKEDPYTNRRDP
jgi:hypothetical protein